MATKGQAQQTFLPSYAHEDTINIQVDRIAGDSLASTFLISIRNMVPLHMHKDHSESIYIIHGSGIMRLGNDTLHIQPGDFIFVPKGTQHDLKVISSDPVRAISIQAPHFDGHDRIFLD